MYQHRDILLVQFGIEFRNACSCCSVLPARGQQFEEVVIMVGTNVHNGNLLFSKLNFMQFKGTAESTGSTFEEEKKQLT